MGRHRIFLIYNYTKYKFRVIKGRAFPYP